MTDRTCPWIDFSKVRQTAVAAAPKEEPVIQAPVVIRFDETTGEQLNEQEDLPEEDNKAEQPPVKLPWREWVEKNANKGVVEADKASAVAALHVLYDHFDHEEVLVDVWRPHNGGAVYVTTPAVAEKNEISIPPFSLHQSKVFEKTENPHAIKIVEKVMRNTAQRETAISMVRLEHEWPADSELSEEQKKQLLEESEKKMPSVWRETSFYLVPEFTFPKEEEKPAVADPATSSEPKWNWQGNETMNPFWAVRRLTQQQLAREAGVWTPETGKPRPRFNCELETQSLSVVTLAAVRNKAVNRTKMLDVPFLTNSVTLVENEELILEVEPPKKEQKAKKRTWREALVSDERKAAEEKRLQAVKRVTTPAAKTNDAVD